ncbi:MAG: nitrous oxide reductase family maturation protein NosD [Myxococcota bacterium]|nr:hypothetical protein [Deltaproteobacteria bacterium]MDP7073275.1 nitrous oxide reductase family maturation protein NosD [Myxococcota bacterium]MDP7300804.1 nitrous oxide reductase family maturation protein NosD [Myxococcota bacterium]MDP7433123.1 nitrous oxide reductase family maturation protein NosD [Myxococcota bacterium]HJO23150.1 nitrous oxide reductase family maturation protein NosD [Myxococcota bacterium]
MRSLCSCLFQGLFLLLAIPGATAGNSESSGHPRSNLQHTLSKAQDGDVVVLPGGTYTGNFEIRSSIVLRSAGDATLTSAGRGTVIRITAPNVRIEGLRFRDSGTNISERDSCIMVEAPASGATIIDNDFQACEFAVWVASAPKARIENNTIVGTRQPIVSDRGNSLYLFNTVGTLAKGNRISGGRDGIYIANSDHVSIVGNRMRDTRFGIHFMYNDDCTVVGNTTTNSSVGAAIMYSKRIKLEENSFQGGRRHGLLLRGVLHSDVIGNHTSESEDGLFLGGSYFNRIRDNGFYRNGIGIVITSQSDDNQVVDNDFVGNRLQAKFVGSRSLHWGQEGRGNYWSGYVGWDSDRNGVGNQPYYATNLGNWLVFTFPVLRLVLESPSMTLLRRVESQFPVLRRAALIDDFPLMKPAKPPPGRASFTTR